MHSTSAPHILIVDDDQEIRDLVSTLLDQKGFSTSTAANGVELLKAHAQENIDLILLDVLLPGKNGFALCQELRERDTETPIILLTARGDDDDRVVGLDLGADDYVPKPFNSRELVARINAVLRRTGSAETQPTARRPRYARFLNWVVDLAQRELIAPEGHITALSTSEYNVLMILLKNAGSVVSRELLLELAAGRSPTVFDRTIDVQISRLRRKLSDNAKEPRLIKTIWGGGYLFAADVTFD